VATTAVESLRCLLCGGLGGEEEVVVVVNCNFLLFLFYPSSLRGVGEKGCNSLALCSRQAAQEEEIHSKEKYN